MDCYFCQQSPPPGGLRLAAAAVIGVCQGCGAAVCAEHSQRRSDTGSASLLCVECGPAERATAR